MTAVDHAELPAKQQQTLQAAVRIEWATIAFLAVAIPMGVRWWAVHRP